MHIKKKIIFILITIYIIACTAVVFKNFDYAITSEIIRNNYPIELEQDDYQNLNQDIEKISDKTNVPMYILDSTPIKGTNEYNYTYYVTSNFKLKNESNSDLKGNDFFSNIKTNDSNQIGYIPYSNEIRKVYAYNIANYKNDSNRVDIFVPKDSNISQIKNEFSSMGYTVIDGETTVIPVNIIVNNLLFLITLLFLVGISIVYFFNIYLKQIYLKKIYGYSTASLFWEYFIKFFKVYLILQVSILVLFSFLNFYTLEQFYFTLIYSSKYLFFFFLLVVLMFLCYSLIVFKQNTIKVIKNKKLRGLENIIYITKFFYGITFCIIMISVSMNLINLKSNMELVSDYKLIEGYSTIRGNRKITNPMDYYNLYENTVNNYNGLLVVPEQDTYYSKEGNPQNINNITVNQNYLNMIKIYDNKHNALSLDYSKDNTINVLIPQKYKGNEKIEKFIPETLVSSEDTKKVKTKITYIEDEQKLPSFSTNTPNGFQNPVVFVVDEDVDPLYYRNIIAGSESYFIKDHKNQLKSDINELGLEDKIIVEPKVESLDLALELNHKILLKNIILIIVELFSALMINISLINMYIESNKKKIYIKKISGYRLIATHKKFIIISQILTASSGLLVINLMPVLVHNPSTNLTNIYVSTKISALLFYIIDLSIIIYFLQKNNK